MKLENTNSPKFKKEGAYVVWLLPAVVSAVDVIIAKWGYDTRSYLFLKEFQIQLQIYIKLTLAKLKLKVAPFH